MQQQYDDDMRPLPSYLTQDRPGDRPRQAGGLSVRERLTRPATTAHTDFNMPVPEPNERERAQSFTPRAQPARAEAPTPINISMKRLEQELQTDRLQEIATLVRALTYGEMIELSRQLHRVRPNGGALDENTLPMTLHLWATLPATEAAIVAAGAVRAEAGAIDDTKPGNPT
jgi:hypothetical protein